MAEAHKCATESCQTNIWADYEYCHRCQLLQRSRPQPAGELVERLKSLLQSVGHHGVNLGEGLYEIGPDDVREAQELYAELSARGPAQ